MIIKEGVTEGLLCRRTSLTPLNCLYIIQKYSNLDEDQFTLKHVDLGVASNEARVDSFKLREHVLFALLTLSSRIISPGLSSVTKKEVTWLWRPERAKVKQINWLTYKFIYLYIYGYFINVTDLDYEEIFQKINICGKIVLSSA